LLGLVAAGTAGYMAVAGYGFSDAVYMTVITISTVGFGEVHPLDGAGRALTVTLIIASFSTAVFGVSVLTELFASGEAARRLSERRAQRMRQALEDHVVVVGFGRVGRSVAQGVLALGQTCLVIDSDPELAADVEAMGAVFYAGDATDDDDLEAIGITRARALIAAADTDAVNLIVVLTAHATNPGLRIVSRVNEAAWETRIRNAGADVVQSPYRSYGMSLAASAASPAVLDLHDLPLLGVSSEEIDVMAGCELVGLTLNNLASRHPGVLVLGLRRDQRLHRWFDVAGPLMTDDVLIAVGPPEHLRALASQASS
jgi:voltage-gated potassium channel